MGLAIMAPPSATGVVPPPHHGTSKALLFCNYVLLGAASSCSFLTLSLRLFPSPCGLFLILLHMFTIAGAMSGCAAASGSGFGRWHGAHMVAAVVAAILQGSVAVLAYARTPDFLVELRSYVREEDGAVILRMVGGLCAVVFFLEWVALALAFVLKYYAGMEGGEPLRRSAKVQQQEDMSNWPWPFHV